MLVVLAVFPQRETAMNQDPLSEELVFAPMVSFDHQPPTTDPADHLPWDEYEFVYEDGSPVTGDFEFEDGQFDDDYEYFIVDAPEDLVEKEQDVWHDDNLPSKEPVETAQGHPEEATAENAPEQPPEELYVVLGPWSDSELFCYFPSRMDTFLSDVLLNSYGIMLGLAGLVYCKWKGERGEETISIAVVLIGILDVGIQVLVWHLASHTIILKKECWNDFENSLDLDPVVVLEELEEELEEEPFIDEPVTKEPTEEPSAASVSSCAMLVWIISLL